MLTVITLLKVKPSPNGHLHGERAFWREWGERYLEKWLESVAYFVPYPHRVVVMTDDQRLPTWPFDVNFAALDAAVDAPGFWAKLNMFRPEVSSGKCLYLDLDNVINGDLSELCALTPDPLIMLDDRRVSGLPNGSAILFDAERCCLLWEDYAAAPRTFENWYVANGDDYSLAYDQAYIAGHVHADAMRLGVGALRFFQDLLPPSYILNARSELPNAPDWRTARLIFGCGTTKPHTSTHPGFALR